MIKARKSRLYKVISVIVAVLFLYQAEYLLSLDTHSDLVKQFEEAKEAYLEVKTGRTGYQAAKRILERLLLCFDEKSEDQRELSGKVFLLLAAAYENLGEFKKAKQNYKKAKKISKAICKSEPEKDIRILPKEKKCISIDGIKFDHLKYYLLCYLGNCKKKVPTLVLVLGGVVVVGVLACLLGLCKSKKELTVNIGEGVEGYPDSGTSRYNKDENVNYSYNLQNGYSNLVVRLDGNEVPTSGTIEMNTNHTLSAAAEANQVAFVTDKDEVTIEEGKTADFQVWLSAQPPGDVNVTVSRVSGDTDISVKSGSNMTFTTENWGTPQRVELEAADDLDAVHSQATIRISANGVYGIPDKDITALEEDKHVLTFVTDTNSIIVKEGGMAKTVWVKLSNQPSSDIQATVTRISGDTDIYVSSGENLTFTTSNWNIYQDVKFRAAEDTDKINGEATFRISASGVKAKDITAIEDDKDEETCTLSIKITSPGNGDTVSGTVTIRAEVSGTCVVDEVGFYIDGNWIATDNMAPYIAVWDTSTYIQAAHSIRVIAFATTGAIADDEITVTVTRANRKR